MIVSHKGNINMDSLYFKSTKVPMRKVKITILYHVFDEKSDSNDLLELLKYLQIEEEYEKCFEIKRIIDSRKHA